MNSYRGMLRGRTVLGVGAMVAVVAQGCGGSTSTNLTSEAGADGGSDALVHPDTGKREDSGHSGDSGHHADSGTHHDSGASGDTGTGGNDSGHDSGSSSDTGTGGHDSGTHDGGDAAATGDSGSDAGGCTGVNTACSVEGADDLCKSGVCSPCVTGTDDSACQAAYGTVQNPFLCLAGVCSPGDCRLDTDCPTGEICGLNASNQCAKCTSDAQCDADSTYANDICNLATGLCVANSCTLNSHPCTQNGGDECCSLACVPGNCCSTTDCLLPNQTCQNNTCTTCALVSNGIYYVDPQNGSDAKATGSGSTGGACAFQTLTRALQFIGPGPGVGTQIEVLNTAPVSSTSTPSAEVFPIVVPANITVVGTNGTPLVLVPAGKTGFELHGASSGLSTLLIDGANNAGTTGILATTGSVATTTLTSIVVENMGNDGIDVTGAGALTLNTGIGSMGNGLSGLRVNGTAAVTITVNTGGTAATFSSNGQHGILVQGGGSIQTGGTLTPFVAVVQDNHIAGLYIQQTPATPAPRNLVSSFEAIGSVTTHGIHIFGGSSLTLRNSALQGNHLDGIDITTYVNGATRSDDVSQIDLGTAGDFGHNTLQYAAGSQPNGGAGICLALTPNAGQALDAAGNVFEAADCSTSGSPGPIQKRAVCGGATDVGITGAATTNTIITSNCAQN